MDYFGLYRATSDSLKVNHLIFSHVDYFILIGSYGFSADWTSGWRTDRLGRRMGNGDYESRLSWDTYKTNYGVDEFVARDPSIVKPVFLLKFT